MGLAAGARTTSSVGPHTKAVSVAARVAGPTRTDPILAADCSLPATPTTSPTAPYSRCPAAPKRARSGGAGLDADTGREAASDAGGHAGDNAVPGSQGSLRVVFVGFQGRRRERLGQLQRQK